MRGRVTCRRRGDRGSGSVLVVAAVAVLVLAATAVGLLGRGLALRHAVAAAADLAALAAVDGGPPGAPSCASAARTTARAGAQLVSCSVDGATAEVVVSRSVALGPGWRARVTATARAGPAGPTVAAHGLPAPADPSLLGPVARHGAT